MTFLCRTLLLLSLLGACARSDTSTTAPLEPPPPGAEGAPEGDRARDELREIFAQCGPALDAARKNIEGADRFDRWTAVGAAAAAYLGMAGDAIEGEDSDGGGGCRPGEHKESSGCLESEPAPLIPVAGTRQTTPHADRIRRESTDHIRSITEFLGEMDEILVEHPDSNAWSQETWARWEGLRSAIQDQCD